MRSCTCYLLVEAVNCFAVARSLKCGVRRAMRIEGRNEGVQMPGHIHKDAHGGCSHYRWFMYNCNFLYSVMYNAVFPHPIPHRHVLLAAYPGRVRFRLGLPRSRPLKEETASVVQGPGATCAGFLWSQRSEDCKSRLLVSMLIIFLLLKPPPRANWHYRTSASRLPHGARS